MITDTAQRVVSDKNALRSHFGTAAARYNRFSAIQQVTANHLIQLVPVPASAESKAGSRVLLDLGCGTGSTMQKLYRDYDGHCIGLDLAHRMLQSVPRYEQGPCSLLQADMQQLPVGTDIIDLLVSNAACQWTAPIPVVNEIARVLKPGAYAVLSMFVAGSLAELTQSPTLYERIRELPSEQDWFEAIAAAGLELQHQEVIVHSQQFDDKKALFDSIRGVGASISPIRHRYLGKKGYKSIFNGIQNELSWRTLYLVLRADTL
ncbi:MAG: methyltransferase domain-containing protein [Proteobacteria bacterium]|jgi:malonyl-CoA O-methyltransferase|nr:methyltransferase domain-containing protein [Pseudomonadota bacterium]